MNPIAWDSIKGADIVGMRPAQPLNWDTHPEWFTVQGYAARIPGRRWVETESRVHGRWNWGPVQWTLDLGEYTVMCYLEDFSQFAHGCQYRHGEQAFVAWVDNVKVDCVSESLDELLVDMVRFKYEGPRTTSGPRASDYFFRMIGKESA